jgi:hypothetical protein
LRTRRSPDRRPFWVHRDDLVGSDDGREHLVERLGRARASHRLHAHHSASGSGDRKRRRRSADTRWRWARGGRPRRWSGHVPTPSGTVAIRNAGQPSVTAVVQRRASASRQGEAFNGSPQRGMTNGCAQQAHGPRHRPPGSSRGAGLPARGDHHRRADRVRRLHRRTAPRQQASDSRPADAGLAIPTRGYSLATRDFFEESVSRQPIWVGATLPRPCTAKTRRVVAAAGASHDDRISGTSCAPLTWLQSGHGCPGGGAAPGRRSGGRRRLAG